MLGRVRLKYMVEEKELSIEDLVGGPGVVKAYPDSGGLSRQGLPIIITSNTIALTLGE